MKQIVNQFGCGHTGKVKSIKEPVKFHGEDAELKVNDQVTILGVSLLQGVACVPVGTEDVCWVRFGAVEW